MIRVFLNILLLILISIETMWGQESPYSLSSKLDRQVIINKYKNADRFDIDFTQFKRYLNAKKVVDYEGIWRFPPYTLGIIKVNDFYIGFIIEADGIYWTSGQVKIKIYSDHTLHFYLKDHSIQYYPHTHLVDTNHLQAGFIIMRRILPYYPQTDRMRLNTFP